MKRAIKTGLFLAIGLVIFAIFIFLIGDMGKLFKKPGYPLYVYFDSAAGLEKQTLVRMAGIKIGFVKDIRLKRNQAEVVLSINPEVQIRTDSKASLAALGLLGEKYIEILPGSEETFCQPGDTLERIPSMSFDQIGTMLLSLGNEVKEVGKSLREIIGEGESQTNMKETVENLSEFIEDLNDFLASNKQELNQTVKDTSNAVRNFNQSVDEISGNLEELTDQMKNMIEDNRENIQGNLESIKELISKMMDSLEMLNESLEKINNGEGTIGKLINDPEFYRKAEETIEDINELIRPVSSLHASFELSAAYYGESDFLKTYLSFTLVPTSNKYFLAQVIRDPWLDKFTYSAQGGLRLGAFSPRAGVMESKFGVGLDYFVFKDRLRFTIETSDFNRDPRPRFRFLTRFCLSKYVYLLAGIDDFALDLGRELFFGLSLGL